MAPLAALREVDDRGLHVQVSASHSARHDKTYVCCDPVVPEHDRVGLPLDTGLDIGALLDVSVEQLEDRVCASGSSAVTTVVRGGGRLT